jgi:hypothetical protein
MGKNRQLSNKLNNNKSITNAKQHNTKHYKQQQNTTNKTNNNDKQEQMIPTTIWHAIIPHWVCADGANYHWACYQTPLGMLPDTIAKHHQK